MIPKHRTGPEKQSFEYFELFETLSNLFSKNLILLKLIRNSGFLSLVSRLWSLVSGLWSLVWSLVSVSCLLSLVSGLLSLVVDSETELNLKQREIWP